MLNKSYSGEVLENVKEFLDTEGYVQLQEVFDTESFAESVRTLDFTQQTDIMHHSFGQCPVEIPAEVISLLVQLGITLRNARAYKLTWKDYSMLTDLDEKLSGFEVIIDLSKGVDKIAGGAVCYVDEETLPFEITPNSLTVVNVEGKQRFFQYLNHHGQSGERVFIIAR